MRWGVIVVVGVIIVLFAVLWRREHERQRAYETASAAAERLAFTNEVGANDPRVRRASDNIAPAKTAEEIVAAKVVRFGQKRRELIRSIAWRTGKEIPAEVEKFFDAIERGNWEEIDGLWTSMSKRSAQYEGSTHAPELDPFWPTVLDVYLTAEAAHEWPAQKLLDYGNAILGSLRPGMVYVGGTDPGRAIPTLMNETGEGEPHVVITQNALADNRYREFVETLYSDRFAALTQDESDRAFKEYIDDAKKRFEHDQQFPNEPKQVRPGETIGMQDGKFQVSGQVAVMDINERMLRMLMEKNPDMSFAMEESFPFKTMMPNATTLGPIMELGVQNEQNTLTPERASQAVDYWRATTQELLSDFDAIGSHDVRMSYGKLISSQAGLLLDRGYTGEAEEAFALANKIAPASTEVVTRYVNLLIDQGRVADAMPIAENARALAPDKGEFNDLVKRLQTLKK